MINDEFSLPSLLRFDFKQYRKKLYILIKFQLLFRQQSQSLFTQPRSAKPGYVETYTMSKFNLRAEAYS
jgi:hypothetical protein